MTVLDAQNLLYEWFGANDSFESNRDLRKVVPIIEDEEECQSAFKLALIELESNSMIAHQEYGDKKYYILTKSYESYNQNVEVHSFTSKWLAAEINEFCTLIEDNTDLCTASGVADKDIRNLVHIIQFYKQKLTEKEEIISGLSSVTDLIDDSYNNDDDDDDDDDDEKNKRKKKKK